MSLVKRKLIALEQAKKRTRNVGQEIHWCFTQLIDLEVTRSMLKAIAAFNFMMNIEGTVLNFEHGIKDLIQFPQSL